MTDNNTKYYLLTGAKQPENLVLNFAEYFGEKSRLEKQLKGEVSTFESGPIRLEGFIAQKWKGIEYTHLLINGTKSTFAEFESYLEQNGCSIKGANETQTRNIRDYQFMYLPSKTKSLQEKFKDSLSKHAMILGISAISLWGHYTFFSKNQELEVTLKSAERFEQKVFDLDRKVIQLQSVDLSDFTSLYDGLLEYGNIKKTLDDLNSKRLLSSQHELVVDTSLSKVTRELVDSNNDGSLDTILVTTWEKSTFNGAESTNVTIYRTDGTILTPEKEVRVK
jgi:hypothetical protein